MGDGTLWIALLGALRFDGVTGSRIALPQASARAVAEPESPPPDYSTIALLSNSANTGSPTGDHMRSITSADAKNNFGELIDLARAAPVMVTKYDRPVVVVMAAEEFERLNALDKSNMAPRAGYRRTKAST